jgi:hypothetical protein
VDAAGYWKGRPAVVTRDDARASATADASEREPIVIRDARTPSDAIAIGFDGRATCAKTRSPGSLVLAVGQECY